MNTEQRTLVVLGSILVLAAVLTAYYLYSVSREAALEQREEQQAVAEARFATLTDLEGLPVTLTPADGRIRLVTHFASWCPSCLADVLTLRSLAGIFPAEEIEFVAINRMESRATVLSYLSAMAVGELSGVTVVIDTADTHYRAVGGYTMPESVLYGRDGSIIEHVRGPLETETIKTTITTLLESI